MGHLKERELSALADGELEGEALWKAQKHLEACSACRDALAELSAHDAALGSALTHDPGEPYFATFADRVVGRIAAAEKAGEADAAARGAAGAKGDVLRAPMRLPWWQRPRALALAGTVTAVVAAAGIVLLSSREAPLPLARSRSAADQALRQSAPATETAPPASAPESAEPGTAAGGAADQAVREDRLQVREANGAMTPAERTQEAVPAAPPVRAPAPSAAPAPAASAEAEKANETAAPAPAGRTPVAPSNLQRAPRGGERAGKPGPASPFAAPPPSGGATPTLRDLKRTAIGPTGGKEEEAAASALAPPAAGPASESTASAPAAPLAKAGAVAMDAIAPTRTVCGTVRDDAGRPLAGVAVTAADGSRSAQSAADGRFCLEVAEGTAEIQLMAVGFRSERIALTGGEELAATLHPIPVLGTEGLARSEAGGEGRPPREPTRKAVEAPRPTLSLGDGPLASLPDSIDSQVKAAMTQQARADAGGGASAYDAAATAWERLLPAAATNAAEVELHARIAECRFRAWQRSGDSRRASRAVEALTRYLTRAPAGERRGLAARWLDQVRTK